MRRQNFEQVLAQLGRAFVRWTCGAVCGAVILSAVAVVGVLALQIVAAFFGATPHEGVIAVFAGQAGPFPFPLYVYIATLGALWGGFAAVSPDWVVPGCGCSFVMVGFVGGGVQIGFMVAGGDPAGASASIAMIGTVFAVGAVTALVCHYKEHS